MKTGKLWREVKILKTQMTRQWVFYVLKDLIPRVDTSHRVFTATYWQKPQEKLQFLHRASRKWTPVDGESVENNYYRFNCPLIKKSTYLKFKRLILMPWFANLDLSDSTFLSICIILWIKNCYYDTFMFNLSKLW